MPRRSTLSPKPTQRSTRGSRAPAATPAIARSGPADAPAAEASASLHEKLLDNLFDGVYFVDRERKITYWNQGAQELTGYSRADAVGRKCYDNFLAHVDESGCLLCFGACPLAATIEDGQRRQAEIYLKHRLGHRVPVSVRVSPLRDSNGEIIGAVEMFSDISVQKGIERRSVELEQLAFRDPLTGVANRRYTELKVNQAIQEVQQFGRQFGLLMIDLDCFKQVNDSRGHEVGDAALRTVCTTIAHNLRPSDTVGRWGGDEFVVVAADVTMISLQAFAERCRTLIAQSAVIAGLDDVAVSVSIGATLLEKHDSAQTALRRTDQLMYKSKARGGNTITVE